MTSDRHFDDAGGGPAAPADRPKRFVFFDCNILDKLAALNIDPVAALDGTEFALAVTPDLRAEYKMAAQRALDPLTRAIAARLAEKLPTIGFFGFGGPPFGGWDEGLWASEEQRALLESIRLGKPKRTGIPDKRTDWHLVALSMSELVVTANENEPHWKFESPGPGRVIWWRDIESEMEQGSDFAAALRQNSDRRSDAERN